MITVVLAVVSLWGTETGLMPALAAVPQQPNTATNTTESPKVEKLVISPLPKAQLSCKEGLARFPYLKPWVEKLQNFRAPVEVGTIKGSLFFALGAVAVRPGAAEHWKTDSVVLPVPIKSREGKIETAWLGSLSEKKPALVKQGPGAAPIKVGRGTRDSSQGTARRGMELKPSEAVDLRRHGVESILGAGPIGPAWTRFWSLLYSNEELELLSNCKIDDCKIKFDPSELKQITGSSHQYRLDQFKKIMDERIASFQKQGHIRGYEPGHSPLDWQDLPIASSYPSQHGSHLWLPANRTQFGYELLDAEPGRHKPVLGLFSRQCEKRKVPTGPDGEFTVCTDLVVYNNHYFDFWSRILLFFPWCGAEVALVYETMDIDQLKGSSMVRILFGGQMRELMGVLLETRLKRLVMLGS